MPKFKVTVTRPMVFSGYVTAADAETAETIALGDVSYWEGRGRARLGLVSSDDSHAEVEQVYEATLSATPTEN
jgi:hypothetical protein